MYRSTNCDIDPNLSKSSQSRSPVYRDAADNAGYTSSDNGINYLLYLDSDTTRSCWYYKSKLFWTWFLYYFCFCGAQSVCKCYFCLCHKWAICKKRGKAKRHVMKLCDVQKVHILMGTQSKCTCTLSLSKVHVWRRKEDSIQSVLCTV